MTKLEAIKLTKYLQSENNNLLIKYAAELF